ncbi:MAG: tetratricopeptide repeat protein [Planctomycetes bacterium]|nr:tetratricopeptide repeat protein [Planctomycetota bacterium]
MSQTQRHEAKRQQVQPTAQEVETFRELFQRLTSLHFGQWRFESLQRALAARVSARGLDSVQQYIRLLEHSAASSEELSEILNLLTVNETYFFRYPAQFDLLRQSLFPTLISQQRGTDKRIRVWSAGCSTGEEPYSIAMAALDAFGPGASLLVEIVATDVSSDALRRARQAEYGPKSLRLLDDASRAKYLRRISQDRFTVAGPVRAMVQFRQASLLDDVQRVSVPWDIIFCRNVLIYFTREATDKVQDNLARSLSPGGYLLVGHSEIIRPDLFIPFGDPDSFVYRRADAGRQPSEQRGHCHVSDRRPQTETDAKPASTLSSLGRSPAQADDCQQMFEAALDYFDRKQYVRACQKAEQLLQHFPRHLPACLLRANAYLHQGEHERCARECQFVLQLDPFNAEAYLLLGINFKSLSKVSLAIEYLKKAAYLLPDSFSVQFHLGEAYRARGLHSEARRAYRNAVAFLAAAEDREIRNYCGAFSRSTLEAFCQRWLGN